MVDTRPPGVLECEETSLIPLRDDQPTSTFPIVTVLLIARERACVYVGQQFLPLEQVWALVPYAVTHGVDLERRRSRTSGATGWRT